MIPPVELLLEWSEMPVQVELLAIQLADGLSVFVDFGRLVHQLLEQLVAHICGRVHDWHFTLVQDDLLARREIVRRVGDGIDEAVDVRHRARFGAGLGEDVRGLPVVREQGRQQRGIITEQVFDGWVVGQVVEHQLADVVQRALNVIDVAGDVVEGEGRVAVEHDLFTLGVGVDGRVEHDRFGRVRVKGAGKFDSLFFENGKCVTGGLEREANGRDDFVRSEKFI